MLFIINICRCCFSTTGVHNDSEINLHFGPVGSGRSVIKGATARQEFAYKHGIQAFDKEFDQVCIYWPISMLLFWSVESLIFCLLSQIIFLLVLVFINELENINILQLEIWLM